MSVSLYIGKAKEQFCKQDMNSVFVFVARSLIRRVRVTHEVLLPWIFTDFSASGQSAMPAAQDFISLSATGQAFPAKAMSKTYPVRKMIFSISRLESWSKFWLLKSSWCVCLKYSNSFFFKLWMIGLDKMLQLNQHCNTTQTCSVA